MDFPATFPLAYWGAKYLMTMFGIGLTLHFWIVNRLQKSTTILYYDDRPWLVRHPVLMMIGLVLGAFGILYLLANLKAQYQMPFYNLLIAGEPFLYSWYALGLVLLASLVAKVMYRNGETRIAGGFTFGSVMLVGMMAPYYVYSFFS